MKVLRRNGRTGVLTVMAMLMSLVFGVCPITGMTAMASESFGYFDAAGNWIEGTPDLSADSEMFDSEYFAEQTEEAAKRTGSYTTADGWVVDDNASTEDNTVYKQEGYAGVDGTSTIACSYLDTNYSVLEYEQLRDMLTNNLLYSNVNAQISASAVYTDAKDYLYILLVDDAAQDFRNIYCYAVGDYRCFCVEVKEYRAEAEQLRAQGVKTPQEAGQGIAESFVWN